jgi:hypothetical protein
MKLRIFVSALAIINIAQLCASTEPLGSAEITRRLGGTTVFGSVDTSTALQDRARGGTTVAEENPSTQALSPVVVQGGEGRTLPAGSEPSNSLQQPSNSLRGRIVNIVEEHIETEINYGITWRERWAVCSNVYEFGAILCVGTSSVLAFSSGFFTLPSLAYAAGATSTVGLVLKGLSVYASGESAERTQWVNGLLRHLGIAPLPTLDNPSLRNGDAV